MSIEINAKDVMKLRNETGLSMMECKKAMVETGGDVEKAKDLLRRTMRGMMDARTDRPAGEGRIAISIDRIGGVASIVEVRCETDFTAKNPQFIEKVGKIADAALDQHDGDIAIFPEAQKLIDDLRISTGENVSYARGHRLSGATASFASGNYVHFDGKIGVLLQAEGSISDETLREICMHITAKLPKPLGVTAKDIPADLVERERKFRIEQAMESGKPKEIAEKMVEGGMRKFYEEVALLEQPFIKDETKKIKDIVGAKANIVRFLRWQVGESL